MSRPFAIAAAAVLALPLPAAAINIPSAAIVVTPFGEARLVRGDDGKDHVEYDLLVTNAFDSPDFLTGGGLPFVIDRFTVTGTITGGDFSKVEITPQNRTVESAYPLVDGVATYE